MGSISKKDEKINLVDVEALKAEDRKRGKWMGMILYPESLPVDWEEWLKAQGFQAVISPLHDKDTFTEKDEEKDPSHKAGELKKAHYHGLFYYKSGTTLRAFNQALKPLHQPRGMKIESPQGAYHYLWHDEQSEKALYSKSDLIFIGGLTDEMLENSAFSRTEISDVFKLIRDEGIEEIADLTDFVEEQAPEYKGFLDDTHSYVRLRDYVNSRRNSAKAFRAKQEAEVRASKKVIHIDDELIKRKSEKKAEKKEGKK